MLTVIFLALQLTLLLQVQGENLVVYFYQLKADDKGDENVSVEKMSFQKSPS